jgi:hypothetical protein
MTEHTADLPMGLVITDDGSILNWQGVNYLRQGSAPSVEQIVQAIAHKVPNWLVDDERVRALAEEIRALWSPAPGDADEVQWIGRGSNEYGLLEAENERLRAALEAADARYRALNALHAANQALATARADLTAASDADRAARAAIEADAAEGGRDE